MIVRFLRGGKTLALTNIFFKEHTFDNPTIGQDNTAKEAADQTGFERLKSLFQGTQDGSLHPGMIQIMHTSMTAFILGGIYGGCTTSRVTFIDFIERNEATAFRSQYDAKRTLSDKMLTSFLRGATKYGSRTMVFCTSFITAYTCFAVYRNVDRVWYYTPAGGIAGALYKFPLGPKAMISGGVFGALLGSVYGGFRWFMMSMTNFTEEKLRQYEVQRREAREEMISNMYKEVRRHKTEKALLAAFEEYGSGPKTK